jgi:hypothetical protein
VQSPFRFFHSFILGVFGAIGTFALLHAPDWSKGTQFQVYAVPALVPLLMILFRSSRAISEFLLERMTWLRRLFAGRRHIEGDWPLVVIDGKSGAMLYYGFMTISFKGGQHVVKGQDWTPDGAHALNFGSMQSYQSESTLHYWYTQGEGGRQRGYTFIEFFPQDEVAQRHTGVFHDKEHPDVRFYARKVHYDWFQKRFKLQEQKRTVAKSFAEEITPRLPALVRTSVDADWG